jgi:hypothetical protein
MTDTTSSDYPCNCRSCGTIISPSVTDMCEECEIAVERNYKKFYTPMTDPDIMDIVTMLRAPDRLEPYLCAAAADEIKRLREERDEARCMLCEEWAKQDGLPLDWQGARGAEGMAEFVGWDCYKENKENTND